MDNFYEFFYSCGLMSRPSRCWSDHIGPIVITIICAVGFCYLLSKVDHTGFFPTRINGEGAREPHLYNEPDPLIIRPNHRRSSIFERIFNALTGFMLAIPGGVMKITRCLTSGINNEKPQDRVMIEENGPLFIESWDRRCRIPRRTPAIPNETSHERLMNQGDGPLRIRSCERLRHRRPLSGRSR